MWDLHVGARVDVLGRTVTLRQASLDVITWLDDQARRLILKKQQLEEKLNKFCHTPYTTVQHHSHVRVTRPAPSRSIGLAGVSTNTPRRVAPPVGRHQLHTQGSSTYLLEL